MEDKGASVEGGSMIIVCREQDRDAIVFRCIYVQEVAYVWRNGRICIYLYGARDFYSVSTCKRGGKTHFASTQELSKGQEKHAQGKAGEQGSRASSTKFCNIVKDPEERLEGVTDRLVEY